jgi:hypothetical protein
LKKLNAFSGAEFAFLELRGMKKPTPEARELLFEKQIS